MKQSLTLLFLAFMALAASAQKNMKIDELFADEYRNRDNVVEVIVKGEKVKAYKLTLFRSLTVKNDAALAQKMEQAVNADAKTASDKETGLVGGKLYYGFFSFPNGNGTYRYLFYRNNLLRKGAAPETTIVYMEGKATLKELKEMFK